MLFDFKGNAAGEEKLILVYRDLTTYTKGNKALRPTRTYTHHSSIVNDVQHHPLHSSLIGTVSDDITLQIIDVRAADTTRAAACGEGSIQSLSIPRLKLSWQLDPQTRPSDCGICETSRRNSTHLRATPILFSQSLGIRLRSLFWPVPVTTVRLCSGISAERARSKLRMMRKMALLNCMSINLFAYSCCH
jgi:hypothetical protein